MNISHVVVNIDSEGLRKPQNLQFCVQVFSADIEFQELIREQHKLEKKALSLLYKMA